MARFIRKSFILFSLLLGVVVVHAEQTLTWEDCVAAARRSNPELLAARHNVQSEQAAYKKSFNTVLPSLSLSDSYTRSQSDTPSTNRWSARGTVSLDLFNLTNYNDISTARSSYDQSQSDFQIASAGILQKLRKAFANLLFSQEQVRVSGIIQSIRKNNASLVSLRYDSGRESKGNTLRSQAELIESNVNVNQSQRDLQTAVNELKRQIGDDTTVIERATGTLATNSFPSPTPSLDDLTNSHPSVLSEEASLRSAEISLSDARSSLWPTLTASYSRSVQGPSHFPDNTYNWSASGVLSLPVFGGGPTSTYYAVIKAKRVREKAQENLRATRFQIRSEMQSALASFASAVEDVDVQTAYLNASRQRNEVADVRYSSGLMSYEDWERIVTERVNFEKSVIRAQRDAVLAEAAWDYARAKGLGD